jgi:hypothetical protein
MALKKTTAAADLDAKFDLRLEFAVLTPLIITVIICNRLQSQALPCEVQRA